MENDPIVSICGHWPFVRRNLALGHARPMEWALNRLCESQLLADGAPAAFGRAGLRDAGLTAGGAGAVYNALVELERRRVVARYRGAGRRPDAWSIRAPLVHWRAMPWTTSARTVESAIWSCICSTFRDIAARSPGQSVALAPQFWLSADDHLRPPGLFLVDSRGSVAKSGASARRPGKTLVDSRGKVAAPSAPVLSSVISREELSLESEERERFELMKRGLGGPVFGRLERQLRDLARSTYTLGQIEAALTVVDAHRTHDGTRPGVPLKVSMLAGALESPGVRALADEA